MRERENVRKHDQACITFLHRGGNFGLYGGDVPDRCRLQGDRQRARGGLDRFLVVVRLRPGCRVEQKRDARHVRRYFLEQLQPLAAHGGFDIDEASSVAAWMRQAGYEAGSNWIRYDAEYHRNRPCLPQHRGSTRCGRHLNHIRLRSDQFFRNHLDAFVVAGPPAQVDFQIGAALPSQLLQTLQQDLHLLLSLRIAFRQRIEHPDAADSIRSLRASRDRPRRRSTEKPDELPPPHSITSSAASITAGGIVSPRAFAVLRFTSNSYFALCSTGRVAGGVPLRILSTYAAPCRTNSFRSAA